MKYASCGDEGDRVGAAKVQVERAGVDIQSDLYDSDRCILVDTLISYIGIIMHCLSEALMIWCSTEIH